MRRMILVAGVAAVAAFATSGSAMAAVSGLDLGGDPNAYIVLSKENKPAAQGPRVAFLSNIACTSGQDAGILVVAKQGGAVGQGAGASRDDCNGGGQLALVLVQKLTSSPQFAFEGPLAVEGFAITDLKTGVINDIRSDTATLSPFSP